MGSPVGVMGAGRLVGRKQLLGDLSDGCQMLPRLSELLQVVKRIRDVEFLEIGLQSLVVLIPLVHHGLFSGSHRGSLCRVSGSMLTAAGAVYGVLVLALPALGRLCGRRVSRRGGSADGIERVSIVIVNAPHMVLQVPLARESISGNGTVTSVICAKVRLVAVTMHRMGFPLMSEEASSRRESSILAGLNLASVRFQVRVNKFARSWLDP